MIIRDATPEDVTAIAAIYAPYVTDSVVSFEADPPDVAEMRRRMDLVRPRYPYLVAEQDGEVLGYAYAGEHSARAAYRWSVDVTVYLAASAHRRGIGRALYTELLARLRAQGFVSAFAGVTLPNPASAGLHEAMGFVPVGRFRDVGYKFGAWYDVGWWQLALADPPADPPEPVRNSA